MASEISFSPGGVFLLLGLQRRKAAKKLKSESMAYQCWHKCMAIVIIVAAVISQKHQWRICGWLCLQRRRNDYLAARPMSSAAKAAAPAEAESNLAKMALAKYLVAWQKHQLAAVKANGGVVAVCRRWLVCVCVGNVKQMKQANRSMTRSGETLPGESFSQAYRLRKRRRFGG